MHSQAVAPARAKYAEWRDWLTLILNRRVRSTMRFVSILALTWVGLSAPLSAQYTGRMLVVRTCPKADSLLGTMRRRFNVLVQGQYLADRDMSVLYSLPRTGPGVKPGIASVWAQVQFPGRTLSSLPTALLQIVVVSRESLPADQHEVSIGFDGEVPMALGTALWRLEPKYEGWGVANRLTISLDEVTFKALARASSVHLRVGSEESHLYDWERRDLNALYRAAVCGTKLETSKGQRSD